MVTKKDITEISFRLFASKGLHSTSMENIAEALGIKKQSLYSHFKSKNEIILSVLNDQASQFTGEIFQILNDQNDKPIDMLLKLVFTHLITFLSNRDRLLLWKRVFLLESTGEFNEIFENSTWRFDRKLYLEMGRIILSRYPVFEDSEKMMSFYQSYMMLVHGYLDWMLIGGFSAATMENAWNTYWNGARNAF